MLNKKNRLNLRFHRNFLQEKGLTRHSHLFTLVYLPQQVLEHETKPSTSRFSVIIGSKIAKKAVDRNLFKRRIHEIIQANLASLPLENDFLIIPKKEILTKKYQELEIDLMTLFKQIPRK